MEDYITYEQAVKLKELGFDLKVNHYYNSGKDLCENIADYSDEDIAHGDDTSYECFNNHKVLGIVCSAPTLAQVSKWLREVHNLHIQIESVIGKRWTYTLVDTAPQSDMYGEYHDRVPNRKGYPILDTYESALSAGIDAALKLIEEK